MNSKPQLSALTGLRFWAALWVVVLHNANSVNTPRFALTFIGRGYVAVDIFFTLSGFILTLNYFTPSGKLRGTRLQFWLARFARIYPVYLLALLLAIPASIHMYRTGDIFSGRGQFAVSFILTAFLQQSWSTLMATQWNYPAWSVSVEAFFYMVFPFAIPWIFRIPRRRLPPALLLCWTIAMVGPLIGFINNPAASYDAARTDFGRFILMVNPVLRLPEFVFGMLLARIYQEKGIARINLTRWSVAALAIGFIVVATAATPRIFIGNGLLAPVWGLLILALAMGKPAPLHRFLSLPLIVVLGEASYGVYILQAPFAWFVFRFYHGPARFAVYVAFLLIGSLVSFWYFETPARNWIRKKSGKRPVDVLAPSAVLEPALPTPVQSDDGYEASLVFSPRSAE